MDVEKLRKDLLENSDPDGPCIEDDLMQDAATALSTLQAENEKLRAEVESLKKEHCVGCSVPAVEAERLRDLNEAPKLRAELERVRKDNKRLCAAMMTIRRSENLERMCVVYEMDYAEVLSHSFAQDIQTESGGNHTV